jgi:hypothetical protein
MENIVRPGPDESEDTTTCLEGVRCCVDLPTRGMDGEANVPGSSNRQDTTL